MDSIGRIRSWMHDRNARKAERKRLETERRVRDMFGIKYRSGAMYITLDGNGFYRLSERDSVNDISKLIETFVSNAIKYSERS